MGLDYYDQNGKRIGGSDVLDDFIITDKDEIERIKKSKETAVPLSDLKSAVLLPRLAVRNAINDAVNRSNRPTSDDPKGGAHEEGGIWGFDEKGNLVISPAKPGPANPNFTQEGLEIEVGDALDPTLNASLGGVDGTYHVHPKRSETKGPALIDQPRGVLLGGTITQTTSFFAQPPSPRDKAAVGSPTNIVVGAGDGKVYFYNQAGVIATFPLRALVGLK